MTLPISTVNYHVWKPCNMRCNFCYATFVDIPEHQLPQGDLTREESLRLVETLAEAGFTEINFAGGEPTLCPWLPELINRAHCLGMLTAIVTNGTGLAERLLDKYPGTLDWVTLSIDSLDPAVLWKTGRVTRSGPLDRDQYVKMVEMLRERNIGVKINTVVTADNLQEDLAGFIAEVKPDRWKIIQVQQVGGQNDGGVEEHQVSAEEFREYGKRARAIKSRGIMLTVEDNKLNQGSYLMVDPAGRFFDSAQGFHRYSDPILERGVARTLAQVRVDAEKFRLRDGHRQYERS